LKGKSERKAWTIAKDIKPRQQRKWNRGKITEKFDGSSVKSEGYYCHRIISDEIKKSKED
jgi:hypothetical protein